MTIFKIAAAADWRDAERAGRFDGSAHDKADGFIHFSTGPQLAETLRLYYAGQNDIVLVAVDETLLGPALKWEYAASRGQHFPHLYGPLPLAAATWTQPIRRDATGTAIVPEMAFDKG